MRKSLCCKACKHHTWITGAFEGALQVPLQNFIFVFLLPNSCSICTKKQNRHFIVPRDDFTLLEVMHLATSHWKGCGGARELWGITLTNHSDLLGSTKVHCRHMKSIKFSWKTSKMARKLLIKEKETQYHGPFKICLCFILFYVLVYVMYIDQRLDLAVSLDLCG